MSVARGNGQNGGHFYSNITKPVKIDISFTVNSTDTAGLGVTSVKSNGYVRNVFMHTSATPGSNNGATNPNPVAGYALIQFNNNFNHFLGSINSIQSPVTGGASNNITNHNIYQIVTIGTTTAAQWVAAGVPVGLTAAVGMSFVAIKTGAIGGTGTTKSVGSSGISSVEIVGNSDLSIANSSIAMNGGAYLIAQFLGASSTAVTSTLTMNSYTPAGTNDSSTPPIFTGTPAVLTGTIVNAGGVTSLGVAAPADGSVIQMSAFFDVSSVTIDGL